MPSTPSILHLIPAQIGEDIRVLGPALVDDPLTCYLFPDSARRLLHYKNCADAQHARHSPDKHWYLYFDSTRQGKGTGGRLLHKVLPQADAQCVPCYLETSAECNVGFYQKHGFKVMSETILPDNGPRMWFMRREPR